MKVLNGYDYAVLVVYMTILIGIGIYFARYMKGAGDYFKAANKLTWWVAGFSSFMAAFSAWMFTGGAGIVYRNGLSGMVTLGLPGVAIFTGYLLFARLWRRSRVTTIMEYLEERFNLPTHQIASWSYVPVYILYSGAALYSLAIFVSTALKMDITLIIWVCGIVILIYTLLGGLWAVSVNDTIQFMVLLPVCLLMVPLSLVAAGGLGSLINNAPPQYFEVPSHGLPWHYMLAYLLILIHGQNTNPIAQRYFSVRNEAESRKVSLLCSGLFLVGIFFWAVPPMAARVLYPDLGAMLALPNPDEGSYVVIALHILPHGLIGLLVAAMFAASLSSLDSIYNLLAGIVSKDIYQRIFHRGLSDKGLLAGRADKHPGYRPAGHRAEPADGQVWRGGVQRDDENLQPDYRSFGHPDAAGLYLPQGSKLGLPVLFHLQRPDRLDICLLSPAGQLSRFPGPLGRLYGQLLHDSGSRSGLFHDLALSVQVK